ncbi:MAG: hypothetical protein QNJ20_06365 [Paracoccaceae bacterium]|nr:hypothetical protein [Paracoccaceae bacterium]
MTTELLALIAFHFACSDISEHRTLTAQEFHFCSAAYQQIKLSFVPGVSPQTFQYLPPRERAAANTEGFRLFYQWRQDNPVIVEHLERVARGEITLGEAA